MVKYIAHDSIPEGIPEIMTPNLILTNSNLNDNGHGPSETAVLAVAKTTAKTLIIGYTIQVGRGKSWLGSCRVMVFLCVAGT